MNRLLAITASAGILLALSGCTAPHPKPTHQAPKTFTVLGHLDLTDAASVFQPLHDGSCLIVGNGYADIVSGASVVITDPAGKTIALGALGDGRVAAGDSTTCDFPFTVPDVPAGAKFYGVEIAHRGIVQFPEAQMKNDPQMTLGR